MLLMEKWISLYACLNLKSDKLVVFVLNAYCLVSTSYETSSYWAKSNSFANTDLIQTEL